MVPSLSNRLYWISGLTDCAAFIVQFFVSRELAEAQVGPLRLGLTGAGLALIQGVASALGGWCAQRFDGRKVFLAGAGLMWISILAALVLDAKSYLFLADYWLLGVGLGLLYPPLIGWLNREPDAHGFQQQVSRRLVLFCVAWNVGMMCGQLTAGTLFSFGPGWTLGAALLLATINLALCLEALRHVGPRETADPPSIPSTGVQHLVAYDFKRLSWIANLGGTFGASLVIHLLPDLIVAIRIAAGEHGRLLAYWRVMVIATYLWMHRSSVWHYRLSAALASQALGACGLLVVAWAQNAAMLLVGLGLVGQLVGFNYFAGLFYSTTGSARQGRALAAGIHEATLASGMACGTLVGGWLGASVHARAPYPMACVVLLIGAGAQVLAYRRWRRRWRLSARDAETAR